MKVRELVQHLSALDQNLVVICWTEDEKLLNGKSGFLLLEIESTGTVAGELVQSADDSPGFKIGTGKPTLAVLNVTSDF